MNETATAVIGKASFKTVYRDLVTKEGVDVKFPLESDLISEHSFGNPARLIPEHYRHKMAAFGRDLNGRSIVVYRHFYGFSNQDRGQRVIADVTVQEKIQGASKVIIVNITKSLAPRQSQIFWGLGINNLDESYEDPITIPDTDRSICFKPIK